MFSFSKWPFLGSMSIFRVVLFLTSTSVCHNFTFQKIRFYFPKNDTELPFITQKKWNPNVSYISYLNELDRFFFSLSREKMTLMFTDNDAWTSSFWVVLVPGGYPFTSNAPGNSQVDQIATAPKGSQLLAGIFHGVFSWSSQLQWKSMRIIPNPKPKIKKGKGVREVFTVFTPPPILWLGINPFKKNCNKKRLNITNIDPKQIMSRCPTVSVDRNPKGFGEHSCGRCRCFPSCLGWMIEFVCFFVVEERQTSSFSKKYLVYVMENIGTSSLAKKRGNIINIIN